MIRDLQTMVRCFYVKLTKVKFNFYKFDFKFSSICFLGLLLSTYIRLSAQIKPTSILKIEDRSLLVNNDRNPILLSNDSNGVFYFNSIYKDTLKFRRISGSISHDYFITLKSFDLSDGLSHCILKNEDRIILLNRLNNSIEFYNCTEQGIITECSNVFNIYIDLNSNEKLIRIEKDNENVYLVSYDFKSNFQNFYLLRPETKSKELLYSNYNPYVKIFFSDDNVSNYSFFNNKLALTDFYSGNSLIIDLTNIHIDSIKLPFTLNEKMPLISTFERLNNKFDKSSTASNYDSLMSLVVNYNHVINSYLLNDSTIFIVFYFFDQKQVHNDMIGIDISTRKAIFEQKRIQINSISESVNISNIPIYIGYERSNYIGDGWIYVYKELPELNKYNWIDFLNKMNQFDGSKIGSFIMYKYKPKNQ